MANEDMQYPGETEEQFYRRKELDDDLNEEYYFWSTPFATTRATGEKLRHAPYDVG